MLDRIMDALRMFVSDLRDTSAQRSDRSPAWPQIAGVILAAVAAGGSLMDGFQRIAANFIPPLASALAVLMLLLFCMAWCIWIVSAKAPIAPTVDPPRALSAQQPRIALPYASRSALLYRNSSVGRQSAKAALLVLALMIPAQIRATWKDAMPLPSVVLGCLIDARSGLGVPDARVRLVDTDSRDITSYAATSDANGLYIVTPSERLFRSAKVDVTGTNDCRGAFSLSLSRAFEASVAATPQCFTDQNKPRSELKVFRHVIRCPSADT